jgi:glyoxylase I family protein
VRRNLHARRFRISGHDAEEVLVSPSIGGFMHVNVNCSDLARSRAFYETALGLVASAHTRPDAPQPGAGFGLDGEARWDAWVLDDPRGMGTAASLDLLRWETPPPTGRPPGARPERGLHRLGYAVRDHEATLERLRAAGASVLPAASVPRCGASTRVAWALDPDGSAIEVQHDPRCGAVEARFVALACSDLERSIDWYASLLGLRVVSRESERGADGAFAGVSGDCAWDAAQLELPHRPDHYALRLEQWRTPAARDVPRRPANHLGPFRMAFLVDDARAWHDELRRREIPCTGPPVWLDMGPEIPIDGLWALFAFDPDGACVEFIQTPQVVG